MGSASCSLRRPTTNRPRICRIFDGGTPRRIASAVAFMSGTAAPLRVSPDGKWFTGPQLDGPPVLVPVDGGESRYLPMLTADDRPLNWSADGKAIFLERGVPDKRWATSIVRYDLATSQITPVRQNRTVRPGRHRGGGPALVPDHSRRSGHCVHHQSNSQRSVSGRRIEINRAIRVERASKNATQASGCRLQDVSKTLDDSG